VQALGVAHELMEEYVQAVASRCPSLKSVWLVGSRVDGSHSAASDWDFLAFGDPSTLECLRHATDLHRSNVDFLVVTDGDQFQNAWGIKEKTGSLKLWEWDEKSRNEAEYMGSKAAPGANWGGVVVTRRPAKRIWPR
jgi:predicted nucleotidyltransferase